MRTDRNVCPTGFFNFERILSEYLIKKEENNMSLKCKTLLIIVFLSLLTIMGCSRPVDPDKAKKEMIAADKAFSRLSIEKGTYKAFNAYIAENAAMLRPDAHPTFGKENNMKLFDKNSKTKLEWEPIKAEIAASGDLGFTIGKWVTTGMDKSGKEEKGYGYYVSIWKRQQDGSWKFVLDTGQNSPPHDVEGTGK